MNTDDDDDDDDDTTGVDKYKVDQCMSDSGGTDADAPNTILQAELTEKVCVVSYIALTAPPAEQRVLLSVFFFFFPRRKAS